jgi:23S rRNA pseudouridine1911/1915/1917 synthase
MNNGQWQIGETDGPIQLGRWLASKRRLGSQIRALDTLNRGRVFVNGAEQNVDDAERQLQSGDVIRLWMDRPKYAPPDFIPSPFDYLDINYEDRYLLAINKPAGQLSTPHPFILDEESLFDMVEEYLLSKRQRPFIVHRIDRHTSGLVLFTKTRESQQNLRGQFERREPRRIYRAVTLGIPRPDQGEWRNWIVWNNRKGRYIQANEDDQFVRDAICNYRVLEKFESAALIEVSLVTGRRNQIRLQAQLHGHPLVGEPIFVDNGLADAGIPFGRQALHAYRLGFRHPIKDREVSLEAPIPDDFSQLLDRLRTNAPS